MEWSRWASTLDSIGRIGAPDDLFKAITSLCVLLGLVHGKRTGVIARAVAGLIGFLAAPVERDLARRENRSLKEDNARLVKENDQWRRGGASDGTSSGGS